MTNRRHRGLLFVAGANLVAALVYGGSYATSGETSDLFIAGLWCLVAVVWVGWYFHEDPASDEKSGMASSEE